jgi:hypothetical protein
MPVFFHSMLFQRKLVQGLVQYNKAERECFIIR